MTVETLLNLATSVFRQKPGLFALALYLLICKNAPGTWLIAGGGLIGIAVRLLA